MAVQKGTGLFGPVLGRLALGEGRPRSMGLAYLLWFGCGLFGLHRLYLGHRVSAAAMAAITLVSLALAQSGLGLLGFAATGAWALADLLLIPEMVRDCNEAPGAAAPKQAPTAAVA
ncbi:MAG: TM2 domain-containing protein [Acetobacteraceae bacterium]|nr:TM2 domain-containing protein [Acetobacteraceae bacterium]